MVNEVLDAYPFVEDKISDYSEAEILKIHASLVAANMRKGRTEYNPIPLDDHPNAQ
jgi:hypothetical protein